ncbi:MAG: O-antigen ligase family protein [Leptotrichiaceae bacterium]|nr:O-antigen ligase family protein [Leptotrichiaceae bacterium]
MEGKRGKYIGKIEKINLVLMFIFIFSIVTMRAVMNISTGLLFLTSLILFFIKDKNKIFKNKWILMLIVSYPLAILLNLFSPIAFEGARNTAGRFYYPLLFFILVVSNFDYKYKKWFMLVFEIAMIVGCVWSFYLYFNREAALLHYPGEDFIRRVRSFESIGRWGVYLMMALVLKYSELFLNKTKTNKIYDIIYFLIIFCALILNNGRGAWLSAGIGILFFVVFSMKRSIVISTTILVLLGIVILSSVPVFKKYMESVKSIGNRSEISNKIRLETWQVGLDIAKENPFFGVGYDKKQKYVLEYREKMKNDRPKEYIDKYLSYSWVIEGSYGAIAAQNGFLYLGYYLIIIVSLLSGCYIKIIKMSEEVKIELLGIIASVVSYYSLQQFYLDLQSYSVYLVYFFLFLLLKKIELEENKRR